MTDTQFEISQLIQTVEAALEDIKAKELETIDLKGASNFADAMMVVSGTSSRHVAAIARSVQLAVKTKHHIKPIGVEGEEVSDWILVDYGDLILHIMLPATRSFYELEKLWRARPQDQLGQHTNQANPANPATD